MWSNFPKKGLILVPVLIKEIKIKKYLSLEGLLGQLNLFVFVIFISPLFYCYDDGDKDKYTNKHDNNDDGNSDNKDHNNKFNKIQKGLSMLLFALMGWA